MNVPTRAREIGSQALQGVSRGVAAAPKGAWLVAGSLVASSILAAGVIGVLAWREQSISSIEDGARALARVKVQLHEASLRLDSEEGSPQESYRSYIGALEQIERACARTGRIESRLEELEAPSGLIGHAEESGAVCRDLAPLAEYSHTQYAPLADLFEIKPRASLAARILPFWASRKARMLGERMGRAQSGVRAVPTDRELDFGTHEALLAASLAAPKPEAGFEGLKKMLAAAEAQQRTLLSVRARYWRTSNGLEKLQAELKKQQSSFCDWAESEDMPASACADRS